VVFVFLKAILPEEVGVNTPLCYSISISLCEFRGKLIDNLSLTKMVWLRRIDSSEVAGAFSQNKRIRSISCYQTTSRLLSKKSTGKTSAIMARKSAITGPGEKGRDSFPFLSGQV
jgi:hypothetical protein